MLHKTTEANGQIDSIPHDLERDLSSGNNWIVQKFGGTSLGKCVVTIAEDIVLTGLRENQIAVVCSARSTTAKSGSTTSRLLQAAEDVLITDSRKYIDIVEELHTEHVTAGQVAIDDKHILEQYIADVGWECYNLLRILESARILKAVTNQTKDMVISVGEKLSCLLMTALLQTKGTNAICIDLGEIIDHSSTVTALDNEFYKDLARTICTKVLALGPNVVPVITGYFGKFPGGLLEQVGRGYTDLCAAITAVGLQAVELQIWKEIDGIFTADPGKVSTARLLKTVTPAEAAELTFYGSEVIHPFTLDQVICASIPIRIKNVMNPRSGGTVIYADPADITSAENPPMLFRNRSTSFVLEALPKQPTAVMTKSNITVLNVRSNKRTRAHGFLASVFSILDQNGLSVDLISSSEVHISMAIHSGNALLATLRGEDGIQIQAEALQRAFTSLKAWGDVSLVPDQAIIFLVGRQLRGTKGISGRFLSTLGDHDINVEMISQGASEISIGCVIKERDAILALNVIHTKLFAFLD
ncbi:aspartate kinase [Setomelanomma holmii]|uniref:Aspartokinase n=1 Tax=Setomelanomma holmii TaxID=210430 RepID=A0A9P4LGD0_9PLEO|nr:aspartate kinase [Setomelanomma holmii]